MMALGDARVVLLREAVRDAVERSFRSNERGPFGFELTDSSGLVEAGLAAVVALIKGR